MLIHHLSNHPELTDFLCTDCRENNVGVNFSQSISPSDYVIIKIDSYFNRMIHPTPAGVDCLIVQKCQNNDYKLYIVELKNIEKLRDINHIREKFQNCFDIFMSDKFRDFSMIQVSTSHLYSSFLYQRQAKTKFGKIDFRKIHD